MKLQQLRFIWEVSQHELNVTATADSLFTSQPGISKQIKLLEDELGVPIFARNGKHLTELTAAGREIVAVAGEILGKTRDIKNIAQEYRDNKLGTLSISTTHTQARYALPPVIREFMQRYPAIKLHINQGTPSQISEQASRGVVDMCIATEAMELFDNLVTLPCYRWNRCILVPVGHPLAEVEEVSLKLLSEFPLVTYTFGFTGRSQLDIAFDRAGIRPRLALTAVDSDVIKTYVRLGLGVGIVAHMAYDPDVDKDLVALSGNHLFDYSITKVCLRRDMFIRAFIYDFIELFAPHLSRELVEQAMLLKDKKDVEALTRHIELPEH